MNQNREQVWQVKNRSLKASYVKKPRRRDCNHLNMYQNKGDGLGYDICFWDENGEEIHIEVKASKLNFRTVLN